MKTLDDAIVNPFAIIDKRLSGLESLVLEFYNFIQLKKGTSQYSDKPLNIKEASEFLGIPKNTLYGLTSRREIPFYKKGRQLFFFREELVEWLKSGRHQTIYEIKAGAVKSIGPKKGSCHAK